LIDIGRFLRSAEGDSVQPQGECLSFSEAPGWGVGVAQTARGMLVHRVRVSKGVITDWTIVAPTEWTCHPQGIFAVGAEQWLTGLVAKGHDLRSPDGLRLLQWGLDWIIRVLDPCVPCKITVEGAESNA
jgi:Ni,Fe-hydrogenase I large subunit